MHHIESFTLGGGGGGRGACNQMPHSKCMLWLCYMLMYTSESHFSFLPVHCQILYTPMSIKTDFEFETYLKRKRLLCRRVCRGEELKGPAPLEIKKQKKRSEQILSYFTYLFATFFKSEVSFYLLFSEIGPPLKY